MVHKHTRPACRCPPQKPHQNNFLCRIPRTDALSLMYAVTVPDFALAHEGDQFGRSATAGRRDAGKCATPVQTQGSDGRHHQGSEAALVLPQAGREASGEASLSA